MSPVNLFRLLFLLVAAGLGAAVVRAEDLNAVKARMEQRQSAVDGLKERHLVGENNRGYLESRANLSEGDQKIVSDENADRRTAYAALAAKSGASTESVGRQRAQYFALNSRRGVWIQDPSGEWRQKS